MRPQSLAGSVLESRTSPSTHYENMPMQYTDFSKVVKIENFQLKNFDIFLIFAQNIDCGYTLEPTIYVLNQK